MDGKNFTKAPRVQEPDGAAGKPRRSDVEEVAMNRSKTIRALILLLGLLFAVFAVEDTWARKGGGGRGGGFRGGPSAGSHGGGFRSGPSMGGHRGGYSGGGYGGTYRGGHFGGKHFGGKPYGGKHYGGKHYGGKHYGGKHYGGYYGGKRHGGYYRGYRGYGYYPHSYSSFGFYLGAPLGWPYYYSPRYYPYYPYYSYPPAIVTAPAEPPVYIEQRGKPSSSAPQDFWYYCEAVRGYYPYVKECPAGWINVAPVPPRQESGYWYRCGSPEGYYPYVRECPVGWSKIVPQTSTASSR
jgi:hypothetical protein